MENQKNQKTTLWLCFFLFIVVGFYSLDYFFRISPSLVLPELMTQYQIKPFGMATFATAFYLGYVLFQIPAGLLLDRYPARWPLFFLMSLSSLFFMAFLWLHTWWIGVILRFLIGSMAAISFVSVLFVARLFLPPKWLTLVSGITIAIGTLSASFIQTINALLMPYLSWHIVLTLFSGWGILLALFLLWIPLPTVQKIPSHIDFPVPKIFIAMRILITRRGFLLNGLIGGLFFAPTSLITAVWGIVFFKSTYHLSASLASSMIFMIFLGWAIGAPSFGFLASLGLKPRGTMFMGALISAFIIFLILLDPDFFFLSRIHELFSLAFLFGLFSSAQVLVWKQFDSLCPAVLTGLGVAITNMIIMLTVGLAHSLVGFLIERNYVISQGLTTGNLLDGLSLTVLIFISVLFLSLWLPKATE